MSTDQLINKAIHCLNTGQPNMAKLYIRKASTQTAARRQELKAELRECKYRKIELSGRPLAALEAGAARLTDHFEDVAEAVSAAYRSNMPSLFALAGPAVSS